MAGEIVEEFTTSLTHFKTYLRIKEKGERRKGGGERGKENRNQRVVSLRNEDLITSKTIKPNLTGF
jgi:hypothetical protein